MFVKLVGGGHRLNVISQICPNKEWGCHNNSHKADCEDEQRDGAQQGRPVA
jgi:hypothetical protein